MKAILFTLALLFSVTATAEDYSVLYEKTSPSVVTIYVMTSDKGVISRGIGSGIVISADTILTAAHVVSTSVKIKVSFMDGSVIDAEVIAIEELTDIAVIKLSEPKPDAVLATIADSSKVKVGQPVFVIGSPIGNVGSLSAGHVSRIATREVPQLSGPLMYVQTDASINSGNSGGGLFNADGHVIGVVSFILSKGGGSNGLGYAVVSNTAKELIDLAAGPSL